MFGYNKLEEKKVKSQILMLLVYYFLSKLLLKFLMDSFYTLMLVQESKILKFLGFMWNPLSWVMEAAAIMAIGMAHGGVNLHHSLSF